MSPISQMSSFQKEKVKITLIDYSKSRLQVKEIKTVEECFPFKEKPTITWINIEGIQNPKIVQKLGAHFGFHHLLVEDILQTNPRKWMIMKIIFLLFLRYSIVILKRKKYRLGS